MICTENEPQGKKGEAYTSGESDQVRTRQANGSFRGGQGGKACTRTFNKLLSKVYGNSDVLGEAGKQCFAREKKLENKLKVCRENKPF